MEVANDLARRSIKEFLAVCWQVLIFPFWLLWKLPVLFTQADTRAFALDVVKTIITAFGLIATLIAGIGLFVNYWSAEKNIQLTQERLVTERFSKAIEQIGSDKEEVVSGGIYSLERITKDSSKDRIAIIEILTSFVRKNSFIRYKEIDIIYKKNIKNNYFDIIIKNKKCQAVTLLLKTINR